MRKLNPHADEHIPNTEMTVCNNVLDFLLAPDGHDIAANSEHPSGAVPAEVVENYLACHARREWER